MADIIKLPVSQSIGFSHRANSWFYQQSYNKKDKPDQITLTNSFEEAAALLKKQQNEEKTP